MGGQAEILRLPGPELLGTSRGETHLCSGFVPGGGGGAAGGQTGGRAGEVGREQAAGENPV